MAEWAQLPNDLIELISKHLRSSVDVLRFRSVCSSWRYGASPGPHHPHLTSHIVPIDGMSHTSIGFYLSKRIIVFISSPISSNPTEPDGWLVKIEEDHSNKKLVLHPLSRQLSGSLPNNYPRSLNLLNFRVCVLGQEYVLHHVNYSPKFSPSTDMEALYLEKVVILWFGHGDDFALLTIHVSGKLAIFRSDDKRWNIIPEMHSPYDDVIVHKGSFYAVDNNGRAVVVGLDSELNFIASPVFGGDKKYFVESEGILLLIDMYLTLDSGRECNLDDDQELFEDGVDCMNERTVSFAVYKLDEEGRNWIDMNNLENQVLFLGDDSTFSALASDLSGCKGNTIFFVDNFFYPKDENDELSESRDICVFELESGCIGPLGSLPEYSKMFSPPPHWASSTSKKD